MKKSLKVLSFMLVICLLFGFVACGGSPTKNPDQENQGQEQQDDSKEDPKDDQSEKSVLPDYDLKKDELSVEIAGWVVPKNFDQTQIDYMIESGVNAMFFVNAGAYSFSVYDPTDDNFKVLDALHKNGIKSYLHAGGKQGEQIVRIEKFKDNPAVNGYVFDEPNKDQIDEIASYVNQYNQVNNGIPLYVNLYPSFGPQKASFASYEDYLRYYLDTVLLKVNSDVKILSADRYPLIYGSKGEKTLDPGWITDVQSVASVAKQYEKDKKVDLKTNFFIQTMSYTSGGVHTHNVPGSRDRVPTYEDIRMQEYALMAFGYDSISLFCYGTPKITDNEFVEDNLGLIDREGNKTDIFYDCTKANQEILAFDHVIMQFDWMGNFATDADSLTDGKPRRTNIALNDRLSVKAVAGLESVQSTQDTLFGYFLDNEENTGLMIVNYNETTKELNDDVTLNFDESYGYNKIRLYVGGIPKEMDIVNNSITLNLGVGEGVFAIPYCK